MRQSNYCLLFTKNTSWYGAVIRQSRSKTACRGFKSFCPCHSKNGLNSEFKPFFCYVYFLVCSTFSTVFLPKNRMKCFKIHRFRRVHHQNSITFLGAKPAQKSADILIEIPQHLRMALWSFALSLFTA